jgi:peptidoglycan/LPS O-acetylase OafA/YrhL
MILGIYCGRVKPKASKYSWLYTIILFISYFFIMSLGKNQSTFIYYSQLLAIIPLHLFLYYMFTWFNSLKGLENKKYIYKPIYWIGNLCLEIYIVQKFLFTSAFNNIFPFNILIVFIGIFLFAYILHICTNFLIQTLQSNAYDIKKILSI